MEHIFYSDGTAQNVCDLMIRNKYWEWEWGKMTHITPDDLDRYHKENGFVYGVVGIDNGKAVAYIEANTDNYQCESNDVQVTFTSFLVDKPYRNSIFSISSLFEKAILKATQMGYQEIVYITRAYNKIAARAHPKLGGVRLNDDIKDGVFYKYHNYMPAVMHLMKVENVDIKGGSAMTFYVNRNEPNKPVTYFDKDIIRYRFVDKVRKRFTDVLINIKESRVVGVDAIDRYFCMISKDEDCVEFKPYMEELGDVNQVTKHCFKEDGAVTIWPEGDEYSLTFYQLGIKPFL